MKCGVCDKDLNDEGQWLRCREHFVRDLNDARAERDKALAQLEAVYRKDRSLIARMAGNIAGTLVRLAWDADAASDQVAGDAVTMARKILEKVDGPNDG
jgi:hypothetical protein